MKLQPEAKTLNCCDDPASPMTARGWALSEADRKLAASLLLLDLNQHRAKGSYKVRIETRWRNNMRRNQQPKQKP
jgi:hypothetical protein